MSPTRRDLFKVAGVAGLAAAGPAGARVGAGRRTTGRKHDYVLMGTSRPGWTIYKGEMETESARSSKLEDRCVQHDPDG